jgi:hypothetical protein
MRPTPPPRSTSPSDPRRALQALLFFWLTSAIGLNWFLARLPGGETTTLTYTLAFLAGLARNDSWKFMRAAVDHLAAAPDRLLYSTLFFEQGLKFIYPPSSLLFIEPWRQVWSDGAALDNALNAASRAAAIVNVLLIGVIFHLSARRVWPGAPPGLALSLALAALFSLTFYPLLYSVWLGQIQTWLSLLFSAGVLAWLLKRRGLAGALVGLICLIKPQLSLFLVWAVLRREWRFALGWAGVAAVLGALSLARYGVANHLDYLPVLSFIAQHGEAYYPNQSINGLLNRMLFNGDSAHWSDTVYPPYHPLVYAGTLISSLALAGAALWPRPGTSASTDFLIAGLSFTLASPLAWEHHFGMLLPVFAVTLPLALTASRHRLRALAALAGAYLLTSNYYGVTTALAGTAWNGLQSYLLFGALLMLLHLYQLRAGTAHNTLHQEALCPRSASS